MGENFEESQMMLSRAEPLDQLSRSGHRPDKVIRHRNNVGSMTRPTTTAALTDGAVAEGLHERDEFASANDRQSGHRRTPFPPG